MMSKEAMKLALEALEFYDQQGIGRIPGDKAITALREALAEQPAQQEPVAFPTRKAVEREIERTANPTGMHLNDGKERVALPGGTLRHMLALIDRTPPPQRTWVGLTDEELRQVWYDDAPVEGGTYIDKLRQVEAKLRSKNEDRT